MTLKPKKQYSFSTIAPGVLGASYTALKLRSIVDYEDAVKRRNIVQLQAAVYPNLYDTETKLEDYTFYVFSLPNNEELILAEQWIAPDSLQETTTQRCEISIPDITDEQIKTLKSVIGALGLRHTLTIQHS